MHTANPTASNSELNPSFSPACDLELIRPLPSSIKVSRFSYMKHPRDAGDATLSLALSLGAAGRGKKPRRGNAAGEGADQFVCRTCSRAFASFQALGGHRTSHLRPRHGLALGTAPAKATAKQEKPAAAVSHQCHVCGLGFEMGQALGGHMRRHREEAAAAAQAPPVLLQLFV
ncbi:zinc finger protein ZAT12-like [Phragmites australis]|uniref:zinc finger protein ZAT12-like n=1 Tax=Phragmites australis TaxID=29695 RepID=UPI002D78E7B4|nr:zinc finger protein ZAT12-like [Phragmites australis]